MTTEEHMDHRATCRTCGADEVRGDTEDIGGQTHDILSCGHSQRAPGPGEFVLSQDGRYEVWGRFEYAPAGR